MKSTFKLISDDRTAWDKALGLYREQLRLYLDYLLPCKCDHGILSKVETEVREQSVPDEFKLRFLSRTLVQRVIKHLGECSRRQESSLPIAEDCPNALAGIPGLERLVYFMRDILEYCTRDTSLMIGITDAQVEQLLSFARKRIDMTEGPSSLEIEMPEGTYFKWKLVDFHLS